MTATDNPGTHEHMPAVRRPADVRGTNRPWLVLVAVLAAELMDLLDATVLTVAGPDLARGLGASPVDLQWILGGYLLTLGAGLVLGGRLGDKYGARRMFILGLAGFMTASLLCAMAPSTGFLIVARFVQGAMGALILPQGFVLVRASFDLGRLSSAMAVFGPVMGAGTIVGPILGGGLVELDIAGLGWRTVFLINLPIGAAAILAIVRSAPVVPRDPGLSLDGIGATLLALSSALLVLPLIVGQDHGWSTVVWVSLAGSVAGFVAFAAQQRRRRAHNWAPLIEPGLFRKPAFLAGLLAMALFFSGMVGMPAVLMQMVHEHYGMGPGRAGLIGLCSAVGNFVGAALAGAILVKRLGRAVPQLGGLLQLVAALVLLGCCLVAPEHVSALIPALVFWGLGSGLVMGALITVVVAAADEQEVGSASGSLAAVQAVAAAAGVALIGSAYLAPDDPLDGFAVASGVNALLLLGFLLVTPFIPRTRLSNGTT